MSIPGRSCPLTYRCQPEALAQPAQLEADTLYVVGRLGDFHWLDVDPGPFQTISETVLSHVAIKGNVETELASDEDAGCGCVPIPTTSMTTWSTAPTRS